MKPSYPLSTLLPLPLSFSIFPFSRALLLRMGSSVLFLLRRPPRHPLALLAPSPPPLSLPPFRLPTVFSLSSSVSTLYGAAVSAAAAAAAAAQVHVAMHSRGECVAWIGASFVALTNKATSHRENNYEMNYRWMLINGYFGELCSADGMCSWKDTHPRRRRRCHPREEVGLPSVSAPGKNCRG